MQPYRASKAGDYIFTTRLTSVDPGSTNVIRRNYYREVLVVDDLMNGGPRTRSPKPFAFSKSVAQDHLVEYTMVHPLYGFVMEQASGPSGYSTLTAIGGMDAFRQEAYVSALTEMYEKMRGSIDLSVDIAQAGQVAKMLKGSLGIVRYIKTLPLELLRGLKSRDMRKPVKDLGSKWLEFQYGWKPLAQTTWDLMNKMIETVPDLMVLEARNTNVQKDRIERIGEHGHMENCSVEDSTRCLLKFRFRPNDNSLQNLGRYTSLNPASIAWELTPWSFVVDWFVDIGGYIRELETSMLYGSQFMDGFKTMSKKISIESKVNVSFLKHGYYPVSYVSAATFTDKSMRRSLVTALPTPSFPRFQADLGSGRLLNAAALLSQWLGKSK